MGPTSPVDLPNRRAGTRVRTIYRVAHVQSRNDQGLARIFNLSDDGMGLRLRISVAIGDTVSVSLSDDRIVEGRVAWTDGTGCGLRLNEAIDSEALLQELATQARSPARRALRIPVSKPALARSERGLITVLVEDISLSGMKVRHDGSLCEALHVKVTFASGLERRGVVRWSRGGFAGLVLPEPFSATDLGSTNDI